MTMQVVSPRRDLGRLRKFRTPSYMESRVSSFSMTDYGMPLTVVLPTGQGRLEAFRDRCDSDGALWTSPVTVSFLSAGIRYTLQASVAEVAAMFHPEATVDLTAMSSVVLRLQRATRSKDHITFVDVVNFNKKRAQVKKSAPSTIPAKELALHVLNDTRLGLRASTFMSQLRKQGASLVACSTGLGWNNDPEAVLTPAMAHASKVFSRWGNLLAGSLPAGLSWDAVSKSLRIESSAMESQKNAQFEYGIRWQDFGTKSGIMLLDSGHAIMGPSFAIADILRLFKQPYVPVDHRLKATARLFEGVVNFDLIAPAGTILGMPGIGKEDLNSNRPLLCCALLAHNPQDAEDSSTVVGTLVSGPIASLSTFLQDLQLSMKESYILYAGDVEVVCHPGGNLYAYGQGQNMPKGLLAADNIYKMPAAYKDAALAFLEPVLAASLPRPWYDALFKPEPAIAVAEPPSNEAMAVVAVVEQESVEQL